MRTHRVMRVLAASTAVVLTAATTNIAAQTGTTGTAGTAAPRSVIVASYTGQDRAGEVFDSLQSAQGDTGKRIESYAVLSKDASGNVRVRDQRRTGTGVGAVVGGVVGLLGGPVGAAVGTATGGAVGYLTGNAVGIPREKVEAMRQTLTPDSSALVVVLENRWAQDIERSLKQAQARQVIANEIVTPAS
jgi:uncharacterized membrane protein